MLTSVFIDTVVFLDNITLLSQSCGLVLFLRSFKRLYVESHYKDKRPCILDYFAYCASLE